MLEVLAHADLAHQLVLVTVHASELANVTEGVLQAISQLEGIDVAQPKLNVGIDNQLGESEDLQVEGRRGTTKLMCWLQNHEPLQGRKRMQVGAEV